MVLTRGGSQKVAIDVATDESSEPVLRRTTTRQTKASSQEASQKADSQTRVGSLRTTRATSATSSSQNKAVKSDAASQQSQASTISTGSSTRARKATIRVEDTQPAPSTSTSTTTRKTRAATQSVDQEASQVVTSTQQSTASTTSKVSASKQTRASKTAKQPLSPKKVTQVRLRTNNVSQAAKGKTVTAPIGGRKSEDMIENMTLPESHTAEEKVLTLDVEGGGTLSQSTLENTPARRRATRKSPAKRDPSLSSDSPMSSRSTTPSHSPIIEFRQPKDYSEDRMDAAQESEDEFEEEMLKQQLQDESEDELAGPKTPMRRFKQDTASRALVSQRDINDSESPPPIIPDSQPLRSDFDSPGQVLDTSQDPVQLDQVEPLDDSVVLDDLSMLVSEALDENAYVIPESIAFQQALRQEDVNATSSFHTGFDSIENSTTAYSFDFDIFQAPREIIGQEETIFIDDEEDNDDDDGSKNTSPSSDHSVIISRLEHQSDGDSDAEDDEEDYTRLSLTAKTPRPQTIEWENIQPSTVVRANLAMPISPQVDQSQQGIMSDVVLSSPSRKHMADQAERDTSMLEDETIEFTEFVSIPATEDSDTQAMDVGTQESAGPVDLATDALERDSTSSVPVSVVSNESGSPRTSVRSAEMPELNSDSAVKIMDSPTLSASSSAIWSEEMEEHDEESQSPSIQSLDSPMQDSPSVIFETTPPKRESPSSAESDIDLVEQDSMHSNGASKESQEQEPEVSSILSMELQEPASSYSVTSSVEQKEQESSEPIDPSTEPQELESPGFVVLDKESPQRNSSCSALDLQEDTPDPINDVPLQQVPKDSVSPLYPVPSAAASDDVFGATHIASARSDGVLTTAVMKAIGPAAKTDAPTDLTIAAEKAMQPAAKIIAHTDLSVAVEKAIQPAAETDAHKDHTVAVEKAIQPAAETDAQQAHPSIPSFDKEQARPSIPPFNIEQAHPSTLTFNIEQARPSTPRSDTKQARSSTPQSGTKQARPSTPQPGTEQARPCTPHYMNPTITSDARRNSLPVGRLQTPNKSGSRPSTSDGANTWQAARPFEEPWWTKARQTPKPAAISATPQSKNRRSVAPFTASTPKVAASLRPIAATPDDTRSRLIKRLAGQAKTVAVTSRFRNLDSSARHTGITTKRDPLHRSVISDATPVKIRSSARTPLRTLVSTPHFSVVKAHPAMPLRGVVAIVEVYTQEGPAASSGFITSLHHLGAKTTKIWGDRVTHVVFKDGPPTILQRLYLHNKHVEETGGGTRVHCVNTRWVTDCLTQGARLPEDGENYAVTAGVASSGTRKRKSMEPCSISNINGNLVKHRTNSWGRSASGRLLGTPVLDGSPAIHTSTNVGSSGNSKNHEDSPATPMWIAAPDKLVQTTAPVRRVRKYESAALDRLKARRQTMLNND